MTMDTTEWILLASVWVELHVYSCEKQHFGPDCQCIAMSARRWLRLKVQTMVLYVVKWPQVLAMAIDAKILLHVYGKSCEGIG
jgi:hypothetical protein